MARTLFQIFFGRAPGAPSLSFVDEKTEEDPMLAGAGYEARTHDIQLGNQTLHGASPEKSAWKRFSGAPSAPLFTVGERNRRRRSADALTLILREVRR